MANRPPNKRTQEEISREQFSAYDGSGTPKDVKTELRAENRSVKEGTSKTLTVGLKDIDSAIIYYFNNVIRPSVTQNGKRLEVPILYGSPERWKAVQKDGFYRDKNGKIQTPLIMFKRESVEKNRSLGNKMDANNPLNYGVFKRKFSKKNIYDRFSVLLNREPVEEYYGVIIPDYVNITYSCVIFTDYVEQMNKIVEGINYASDSYWGDPERFKFRAMIDNYSTATELSQGQDRAVKTTFSINLLGHIIPDTINTQQIGKRKFFSKSAINFGFETISSDAVPVAGKYLDTTDTTDTSAPPAQGSEVYRGRAGTSERQAARRFFDNSFRTATSTTINTGMTTEQITFVSTVNNAIASSSTDTTATFTGVSFLTPPTGFTVDQESFTVYVNGLIIPTDQRTVAESGSDIVVTFDTDALDYTIESDDQVVLTGKFS